jgi:hypothetical protein
MATAKAIQYLLRPRLARGLAVGVRAGPAGGAGAMRHVLLLGLVSVLVTVAGFVEIRRWL